MSCLLCNSEIDFEFPYIGVGNPKEQINFIHMKCWNNKTIQDRLEQIKEEALQSSTDSIIN